MELERKKLLVFGYGLAIICGVLAVRHFFKSGVGPLFCVGVVGSLGFAAVTRFQPQGLVGFYRGWMKVARLIGAVFSTVILSVLFYLMFGVVGLILRLMKKDILEERRDPKTSSYWKTIDQKPFNPVDCKRQF